MLKNLTFRNPGFEGETFNVIIRCGKGSATTCQDENEYSSWPAAFFNGASFEFIYGSAKGRTGTVTTSAAPDPTTSGSGVILNLSNSGTAVSNGDYVVVKQTIPGNAQAGWWTSVAGGATLATELADLPPGTNGKQALKVNASGTSTTASVSSYFDSLTGYTFVQLQGAFRASFKAKGLGGANTLTVSVSRVGATSTTTYGTQTFPLTGAWQTYNMDFTASEKGAIGTVQLSFSTQNTSLLLDDATLLQTDGLTSNTTAFRDPVVSALQALSPGIIRYMGSGTAIGASLDNLIAPPFGRVRAGYSAWANLEEDVPYGLHEFLELCDTVDAEPWFVVPVSFSPKEMANLIEYLAGPSSSPYGAKRAARGRSATWSSAFNSIHLEFGNEAWNGTFKGASIEYSQPYGQRANDIFQAARASSWYIPSQFDLVVGGQAVSSGRNAEILSYSTQHDTLTVAPYLAYNIDSYSTNENLFGPTFAEPQQVDTAGFMLDNYNVAKAATRATRLSVYEVNLHTTGGAITQAALDSFTPSTGAGIAVAGHMLLMLRQLGITDQTMFALPQLSFNRGDGKSARLWGMVVDMGVTNRRRPQFLAAQLANKALSGSMVKTTHSGSDPTWNQALVNGVQFNNAHYLLSFAFSQGNTRNLVIFNYHRTSTLPVTFTGANAPNGTVTVQQLTSPNITDTNETAANVNITSRIVSGFVPSSSFTLAPYSMTLLTWTQSSVPPLTISGVAAQNITTTGASISWSTNRSADSLVEYGTTTAYGQKVSNTSLVTAHNATLSSLAPGTLYFVRITSKESTTATPAVTLTTFQTLGPTTLSNVAATPGGSGATITWTSSAPASTQVFYGLTTSYGSSTALDSTLVTAHTATISSLSPSTTYYFQVQSKDASGSLVVAAGSFATPAMTAGNLVASSVTSTSAIISWTTNIAADSRVEYGTTTAYGLSVYNASLVAAHQMNLTGLVGGNLYYIRATSKAGSATAVATGSFTTTTSNAGNPVISNVRSWNVNSSGATISWTTDLVSDSTVLYGLTAGSLTNTASGSTQTLNHQVVLTALPNNNGGTYYYIAQSKTAAGGTGVSVVQSFTLPDKTSPAISSVSILPSGTTGGSVSWATSEPATAQVQYGTTTSYGTWTGGTNVLATTASFSVTGLKPSTNYHFQLRSTDKLGNQTISQDYTFTTAATTKAN
ncbi:MAG: fibronectin type III domain-containing protein [Bryobacteraceae bacterium]